MRYLIKAKPKWVPKQSRLHTAFCQLQPCAFCPDLSSSTPLLPSPRHAYQPPGPAKQWPGPGAAPAPAPAERRRLRWPAEWRRPGWPELKSKDTHGV